MKNNCNIDGCDNSSRTRGMCVKHYTRWIRNGDPTISLRARDGRAKHPLHKTYKSLKNRCFNPNEPAYKDYGGRGITVCDRWLGVNGFWHFVEDMGDKPSPSHSVDRIDNGSDYSPENCRWADKHTQAINTRNVYRASGFTIRKNGKFRVRIRYNNVSKHLGDYKTAEEAIEVYNTARTARLDKLTRGA